MFVRSISDAAHRVAQRVVAAIFLLLPASRLPPSFVYCARPLVEHPMARGPLTVGNLRDSRNGRFDSVFFSRGIWKRRSRITRITETDRLLFEAIVTVIEEMMILEELFLRFTIR